MQRINFALALVFVCFHVYTALFGVIPGNGQKSVHLGLVLGILFSGLFDKDEGKPALQAMDIILLVAGMASAAYIYYISPAYELRGGITYVQDVVFGTILIVTLLLATWRRIGPVLSIVAMLFVAYAFFGKYAPLLLKHAGFTYTRYIHLTVYTADGIFGTPLNASATFIVVFIILGAVFNATGVGDYMTSLATCLFGRFRGGPAKVAVVASALFGSISGSASANVIGTGTFTIPMMKKMGFDPEFSGAVEATASTGGQIMPPVMGSAAFLMAEVLQVRYWDVVKAAIIPALLYFIAIMFMVDLYARRNHIRGMDKSEVPDLKTIIRKLYLLSPLVLLIILISVTKLSITRSGIYTLVFTVFISCFDKDTRLSLKKLKLIVLDSGRGCTSVAIACALVGVIIATVLGSGLSYRLSNVLVALAAGRLNVLLIITMITALILGMGLPSTACYLVLGTLVAPAIMALGVVPMAAHMFVFYFGITSNVTPPVALASYAAAGIARCNPSKCGYKGFKLAIAGFILPFMFVNNPVLLGFGNAGEIILCLITALVGIYSLACAAENYIIGAPINIIQRIFLFGAALLCIDPNPLTDITGIVIIVLVHVTAILFDRKKQAVR